MIRVLSVEDDPVVQAYLAARLGVEPDLRVVGQVATAAAACRFLREGEVDVVLLDYQLGGRDGLQLLQALSLWFEELPPGHRRPAVLFCTGCADEDFEIRARGLGADGVVAKVRATEELIPAVRAVAAGNSWFGRKVWNSGSSRPAPHWDVLLAAQDRRLRAQLGESLLESPYHLSHAWRSEEVLGRLEAGSYDLLVLEDRLTGRILSTALLEQTAARWPALPVLFLATLPPGMEHYSPGANVWALVRKPVSVERLQKEIAGALARDLHAATE